MVRPRSVPDSQPSLSVQSAQVSQDVNESADHGEKGDPGKSADRQQRVDGDKCAHYVAKEERRPASCQMPGRHRRTRVCQQAATVIRPAQNPKRHGLILGRDPARQLSAPCAARRRRGGMGVVYLARSRPGEVNVMLGAGRSVKTTGRIVKIS